MCGAQVLWVYASDPSELQQNFELDVRVFAAHCYVPSRSLCSPGVF